MSKPLISNHVVILTVAELDDIKNREFHKGVKRGRFDERTDRRGLKIAENCANWKDGCCDVCGVQWQSMEVSKNYECKNFVRRT